MADEQSAPQSGGKDERQMTREEFVTKAPLYVKIPLNFHPPSQISFNCWHEKCKKETTWVLRDQPIVLGMGSEKGVRPIDFDLKSCEYICVLCQKSLLTIIYRDMEHGQETITPRMSSGFSHRPGPPPSTMTVVTHVMKVGQFPAPTIAIPKRLEKNLGEEAADFYRKALMSRNSGFGLAAATYIRRVVEDKTNELIELAANVAESHQLDAETVAAIRRAADSTVYTTYDEKLKYASTVFPQSLLVGSYNPLSTLYSLVSKGIHGLTEEECIVIADDTTAVFEYVFAKLRTEITDRNAFIERMKRLNQPPKKDKDAGHP